MVPLTDSPSEAHASENIELTAAEISSNEPTTEQKAGQIVFVGNGPCRDRHGKEPGHWNCQEPDVISARRTCELACADRRCRGYQVCEQFICTGVCVIFTDRLPEMWLKNQTGLSEKCSYVPGTGDGTIEQTREEESMWKCYKRNNLGGNDNTSTGTLLASLNSTVLSPDNPLIDGLRNVIRSHHDLMNWRGKWQENFKHSFGSFLSTFAEDQHIEHYDDWAQVCPSMQKQHRSDYVVLAGFDDNWYPACRVQLTCSQQLACVCEHASHECAHVYNSCACACCAGAFYQHMCLIVRLILDQDVPLGRRGASQDILKMLVALSKVYGHGWTRPP